MSEAQKCLWFLHQIAPNNTAYNEYNAVKINSPLDIEAWKATWQRIVERHSILRTTYGTDNEGEPVQIVHPTMNVPMQVIDAKGWSEEAMQRGLGGSPHERLHQDTVKARNFSLCRCSL
ncbi:MAG: hypothetical protein F6J90_19740 [Moorea sp. SIOASIH]|uniref:condensation domain-containing protein n=1 Tax=Moorena sp. SIOASIH TaxID=2607817 RepID=UPI0013BC53AF|nr:condensation domain-containing protein [Moorena sp. SIOASIH]NEO38446.1 hypothetical protein [Moorena sp. SIOASIH]